MLLILAKKYISEAEFDDWHEKNKVCLSMAPSSAADPHTWGRPARPKICCTSSMPRSAKAPFWASYTCRQHRNQHHGSAPRCHHCPRLPRGNSTISTMGQCIYCRQHCSSLGLVQFYAASFNTAISGSAPRIVYVTVVHPNLMWCICSACSTCLGICLSLGTM